MYLMFRGFLRDRGAESGYGMDLESSFFLCCRHCSFKVLPLSGCQYWIVHNVCRNV